MHARQELTESARGLIRQQAGLITRQQALGCDMAASTVTRMARQWQPLARGIYLTTPVADGSLTWEVRAWSGVLRFGPRARLWLNDAAIVHGLVDRPDPVQPDRCDDVPITFLVPIETSRLRPPGYQLTRERPGTRELSTSSDPAATRVEDTVLDLISHGDQSEVITWLTRAVQRRRTTPTRLLRRLEQRSRLRHRALVIEVLDDVAGGSTTHLEVAFVRDVLRLHELPVGDRQQRIGHTGAIADLGYRDYRLIVEVDGRVGHVGEGAFRDRKRDNAHTVLGWTTLRFGWTDVTGDPCGVAAQLAEVLVRSGWSGMPTPCPRCRGREGAWA